MIRRLLVGAVIVAVIAGFAPTPQEQTLLAAPNNVTVAQIRFARDATPDGAPIGEAIEFFDDNNGVWAIVDFAEGSSGARLSYVLRLNGEDYTFGNIECCGGLGSGRFAFQLRRPNGNELPGGSFRLFLYEGFTEIGQAGFGIRGGQGADNGNAPSNTRNGDNDNN